jgi:alpha-galactosidase
MTRIAILVVTSILCWGFPLFGSDVSGRWRLQRHVEDGNTLETFLDLGQQGSRVTGKLLAGWGDLEISDGQIEGGKILFTVQMDPGYALHYGGDVSANQMRLTLVDAHAGSFPVIGVRMAADEPISPARLPLPKLHVVKDNGLVRTPPMGWNSWNFFQEKIDDAIVRQIADVLVASGMRDAGYVYINIDDTWEGSRDSSGRIQANKKFPDMKALADYVHSKGLKLGIYSSPGPKTCAGYEGSYGHEEQDAKTFAGWGIDYLKYDWCSASRLYKDSEMRAVYQKMGDALLRSGRPIVYSLCQYGKEEVWKWGKLVGGNLWRTTDDISDKASSMFANAEAEIDLAAWAEPGHWNDPDMLEIGNGGMSADEYRSHMTFWSILAAPLIAGNDLRNMTPEIREILMNAEVIAVDQDALGKQGTRLSKRGDVEIWMRPLAGDARAVAILNPGAEDANVNVSWVDFGISDVATVRDLWSHRDLPEAKANYSVTIKSHSSSLVRLQIRR